MEWFVMVCHGQVWYLRILGTCLQICWQLTKQQLWDKLICLCAYILSSYMKLGTVQRCIFCWQISWQLTHQKHWDKLTCLSTYILSSYMKQAGNSPKVQLLLTDMLTVDTSKALGPVFCICRLSSYMKQTGNWCTFCIQINWQLTHQHLALGQ